MRCTRNRTAWLCERRLFYGYSILKDEPYAKTRINLRIVWKNIISLRIPGVCIFNLLVYLLILPVETCNRISQLTSLRITSQARTPLRFLLWKKTFFLQFWFSIPKWEIKSPIVSCLLKICQVFSCASVREKRETPQNECGINFLVGRWKQHDDSHTQQRQNHEF